MRPVLKGTGLILAIAFMLQIGVAALGQRFVTTPAAAADIGPPKQTLQLRLGDIPLGGLPFLLATLALSLLAITTLRAADPRVAVLPIAAGLGCAIVFVVYQIVFMDSRSFSHSGAMLSGQALKTMGKFGFWAGVIGLVHFVTLALVALRGYTAAAMVLLTVTLGGWSVFCFGWLLFLYSYPG